MSLNINLEPFQLTFSRAEQILLRSAPDPRAATLIETSAGIQVDLGNTSFSISRTSNGFKLDFSGESQIAFELIGHWYGHGELLHQRLPLERLMLPLSPFETFDNGPAGQSCKLTPAWYSSTGILIRAESPLLVGINQPPAEYPRYEWSLGAEKGPFAHRPFAAEEGIGDGLITFQGKDLILNISFSHDALSAFQQLSEEIGIPSAIPPIELFTKPTWTTWARYKTEVSQDVVLNFAGEIIENGYPYGVLEIDDRWQKHYGDIAFDPIVFQIPKR